MTNSRTTQNVAAGATGSGLISGSTIALARSLIPNWIFWDVAFDEEVAILLTALLTPFFARWLAFHRNPKKRVQSGVKRGYVSSLVFSLFVALAFSGCATNGIKVTELTPDGASLEIEQTTRSSVFSKTKEGAGDFVYEGIASDGSSFNMRAGAGVVGQQGGDPADLIRSVLNILRIVSGQHVSARAREGGIKTGAASEAIEAAKGR